MGKIDLVVEKISGGGEGLGDVGEHVCHGLVDGRPVWAAADPLATLCEGGKVEGFISLVPAKVGKRLLFAKAIMCIVVEMDFRKLVSSGIASLLRGL